MNIIDQAIGALLLSIATAIRALGIRTIDALVWMDQGGPPLGTFWPEEWSSLTVWYWTFSGVALFPGLIQAVISAYGLRMVVASGSNRARVELYRILGGLLGLLLLILLMPLVVKQLLLLNAGLVDVVAAKLGNARHYFGNPADLEDRVQSQTLAGAMHLILVGVEFMLNYLYVIRKLVIGVSFVLTPLAGWVLVLRNTYTPLLLLLSEIVSNAFMQASHAVTIAMLTILLFAPHPDPDRQSQWWIVLMAPTMLPLVSAYLRRLLTGYLNFLGVNEERWAGWAAGAAGGLMGIMQAGGAILAGAGAGRAFQSAFRGSGPGGGGSNGGGGGTSVPLLPTGWGAGGASGAGVGAAGGMGTGRVTPVTLSSLMPGSTFAGHSTPGSGGSGLMSIPVSTPSTGGGPRPGPEPAEPESWIDSRQSPSRLAVVGPSDQGEMQLPNVLMTRSHSGLYTPAGATGTAPLAFGGSGAPPEPAAAAGKPLAADPATPGHGARDRSLTRTLASQAGRSGLRAAEVVIKGGAAVSAALIGLGLAAYGGPRIIRGSVEAGNRVAEAAWRVPQRAVVSAQELYARLRHRRDAGGPPTGSRPPDKVGPVTTNL